jgi:hypothetical protein
VVERWHQLPLGHALARLPLVRDLVQRLADEAADAESRARVPVPDLGPAVVMDQLRVMVHDVTALGAGGSTHTLAVRLADLRRAL